MRKLKQFTSLKWDMKLLIVEAYLYLAYARLLKALPFVKIAPLLGKRDDETTYAQDSLNRSTLAKVAQTIHMMSHYTFWESQCLVQAIAAMKMLKRRHINSTLYLGTAKDESGNLVAHAWLRSGAYYITGSEEMEQFTVVQTFARHS